jgi:hypothetical protein
VSGTPYCCYRYSAWRLESIVGSADELDRFSNHAKGEASSPPCTGDDTVSLTQPVSTDSLPLRALAAALVLLSGAVMMLAGHLGNTESWTTAGFITVPGGVVILIAFALARRAERADGRRLAVAGGHRTGRAGVMATTLLSGGVMVLAGYAASAWGWGLAAALATLGGGLVAVAFAVDRRGVRATAR